MANRLLEIEKLGQAIWIDNLNRELLDGGTLRRLIEEDGLSGVTSNPTIFEKGMGKSDRYDDAFREVVRETEEPQEIFERLALRDVRDAADLLRQVFDETAGQDGYVSFELPASLAHDAGGSVEQALRLRRLIDRPNVLIKVPGTEAGVRAFEELTAGGVNVNVTLLFAVERYREIAEAYVRGLERREASWWTAPLPWRASSYRAWTRRSTRRSPARGGRTCAARPRWPTQSSPTPTSRESSRGSVGRRCGPPARTFSVRSGPRPRPRTPTTRTRCMWTS